MRMILYKIVIYSNLSTFWTITPYSTYVNRRFGGMHHLHIQGRKSAEQQTSVQQMARDIGEHMDHTALYSRRWQHS
jgi:hypothetical protein